MENKHLQELYPFPAQVPARFRLNEIKSGLTYLVNGEIREAAHGQAVISPIKIRKAEQLAPVRIGQYADLNSAEALEALTAARQAWQAGTGKWATKTAGERIEVIRAFSQHMCHYEEVFNLLAMWEIAKPYSACKDEFARTIKYIEDTISSLENLESESRSINIEGEYLALVKRCPLGVVLCMGPFNYPLNETFAMLIPALIMGNSVVMKPPQYGALCTLPLLEEFARCFPPGVINIINGDGEEIIGPIMRSGQVSVLGFIGSTRVANLLIGQHPANNRLRTILGLEAKNPAFVFPDADLDLAARECVQGALEFNGQRCTAIKHVWVHASIADEFLACLEREINNLKCGMPWEEEVFITPLAEKNKPEWLARLVDEACNKGARVVNGGGGEYAGSLFYPTILFPVNQEMEIYNVEQFGPVIPVSPFKHTEELVEYLAASDYGQQASIFSSSAQTAAPLIDVLVNQVSRVNLNAQCRRGPDALPFTGRKDSAEGTLSISDALKAFSIRSLAVANEAGRDLFFDVLQSGCSRFLKL
ncbi:aldehyde dehydrogenase family protein [Syntrophomonas erecta]